MDRVREASVLGTGGRLRHLAPWWVVSILGMTPGEMMWGEEGEGLSSSSSQEAIDSSLDLCTIFFALKQSKNSEE